VDSADGHLDDMRTDFTPVTHGTELAGRWA
jgi:hypothetical protein